MFDIFLLAQNEDGIFLLGGGMMLVMFILGLATLALWIWALVDAIKNRALSDTERIIWVLVILLTNLLGAVLYLLVGRKGGLAKG